MGNYKISTELKQVFVIEADILNGLIRDNVDLLLGVGLYALTAFLDAAYTIYGINTGVLCEGNPIPQICMDYLGPKQGLAILKCFVGVFLLIACNLICTGKKDIKYLRYLPLYILSIAQLIAAAAWQICISQLSS
jgi:hypothetical protein